MPNIEYHTPNYNNVTWSISKLCENKDCRSKNLLCKSKKRKYWEPKVDIYYYSDCGNSWEEEV